MTAPSSTGRGPDSTTPESGPPGPIPYAAFDDFYAVTQRRFLAYARYHATSREQALDAVQDAYLDVLARWDTINNPTAYGITAVRRNVLAQNRLWARTTPTSTFEDDISYLEAEPDPTDIVVLKDMLFSAIKELPPTQRTIVVLRYVKSMNTDEIATSLEISRSTVRAHLSHARRRLRDLLTDRPPTPRTPAPTPSAAKPTIHTLYDRYADFVYRYICLLVGTGPTAEELTSKTFLRALPHLTTADPETRLIATARALVSATQNTAPQQDTRRRAVTALLAATAGEQPAGLSLPTLLSALNDLNPAQYECIVLRFLQGLSVAESARVMNRSEGALKLLQHRALKNLAQDVDNHPTPHDTEPADVSRTLHAVAPRCSRYLTPHPAGRHRMRAGIERPAHADTELTR
ncbi:RNA polymerase sigma factor [Streptomyces rishiriensis]|uniref:RNA polymerase sigma factor n=1 Tax=Streptomyces rishiriensis TaxID=68264 RepID=UPI000D5A05B6|nr:sigma-70 family RNA polymerase sigma factor [Streptomyces rishiriensis]